MNQDEIKAEIARTVAAIRFEVGSETLLTHWKNARKVQCNDGYMRGLEFAMDLFGIDWRAVQEATEKHA